MAKIRQDKYGLFVKAGGYLFRPQPNDQLFHMDAVETKYHAGDDVVARHRSQTTTGKVGDELWFSHGEYESGVPSETYWDPPKPRPAYDPSMSLGAILGLPSPNIIRMPPKTSPKPPQWSVYLDPEYTKPVLKGGKPFITESLDEAYEVVQLIQQKLGRVAFVTRIP